MKIKAITSSLLSVMCSSLVEADIIYPLPFNYFEEPYELIISEDNQHCAHVLKSDCEYVMSKTKDKKTVLPALVKARYTLHLPKLEEIQPGFRNFKISLVADFVNYLHTAVNCYPYIYFADKDLIYGYALICQHINAEKQHHEAAVIWSKCLTAHEKKILNQTFHYFQFKYNGQGHLNSYFLILLDSELQQLSIEHAHMDENARVSSHDFDKKKYKECLTRALNLSIAIEKYSIDYEKHALTILNTLKDNKNPSKEDIDNFMNTSQKLRAELASTNMNLGSIINQLPDKESKTLLELKELLISEFLDEETKSIISSSIINYKQLAN